MTENKPFDLLDYTFKLFVVIGLIITAAVLASDIVIPILLAGFLSVVLLPIVNWLQKRLSLTFSVIIVIIVAVAALIGTFWIIGDQLSSLVQDLPDLENRFNALVTNISTQLSTTFGLELAEQNQMMKEGLKSVSSFATNLFLTTTNTLSLIIQIPIYIFLFLLYRDRFKAFIASVLPPSNEANWKEDIESVLQGYISGLLLVTIIIAILNTVGLAILGIEHAIFFGVFSGLLTIIPYVGIFIGALLPALFALLTKDSIWYTVGVIGIFSFVQFLEGNFITPKITGSKVSINALAAIVALLIGGKILGIAGMILAVPITGVLKVILAHSNNLKSFVILLDDNDHQVKPKKEKTEQPKEQKKKA